MAYEHNVYAFPQGGKQEQEPEQPQFLPADVGAETLDAYMNFRQSRTDGEDAFQNEDYQEVGHLLQRLWPIFTNEGELGIYAKLEEIHETLAAGKSFERNGTVVETTDDAIIQRSMQLIELAREEKVEFLQWKNNLEAPTEQSPDFPTDAIGQCEVAIEYFFTDTEIPASEKTKAQLLAGLDILYRIRPLTEGGNTASVREQLEAILETLLSGETFTEEDVTITPYSIKMVDAALEIATYTETHTEELQSWHAQLFVEKEAAAETNFPMNAVSQIEVAAEYLFIQSKDTATSAQREQMLDGLDMIERLRPVFDSISGYSISEAIKKILETINAGYDFERAGVRLSAADTAVLAAAETLALFTENNQELLQDWCDTAGQNTVTATAVAAPTNTPVAQAMNTPTESLTNLSAVPEPANTITGYSENDLNEEVASTESLEAQEQVLPVIDQAKELKRFMDFLDDTTEEDFSALKDLFNELNPLWASAQPQPLTDLLASIAAQLATGAAFTEGNVTIEPSQLGLISTAIELIPEIDKQRDAFEKWQVDHPDTEEEEEGTTEVVGEQLFGAVAGIAAENALTETWKNQTRHFSEEMSKLQKEVITRRLDGLPHIFPPDFESIVGQFIYRLNRVTEFKPTMITEFESEFTELLGYFDLRMLRTAGEELDQELPDDIESLERVNNSLDTIDEQITNLMLLQTSQGLITELRNVKHRLDLLRSKMQYSIKRSENTDERLAA